MSVCHYDITITLQQWQCQFAIWHHHYTMQQWQLSVPWHHHYTITPMITQFAIMTSPLHHATMTTMIITEPYWYHPYTTTMWIIMTSTWHHTFPWHSPVIKEWMAQLIQLLPPSLLQQFSYFFSSHSFHSNSTTAIGPWFAEILNITQNRPYQVIWQSIKHYTLQSYYLALLLSILLSAQAGQHDIHAQYLFRLLMHVFLLCKLPC